VCNGNRWRVIGVDTQRGRIVAERLTDSARVIFDGDYLREHITLGYASTVHSAQGMTIGNAHQYGVCWSIMSDRASRAMAYVGMTRGWDENHLAIYPVATEEAHQQRHGHDDGIHQTYRGTKEAAAHYVRMILAHDDRAHTMHTVAARTDYTLLPTVVAGLLERNDRRRVTLFRAGVNTPPRPVHAKLPTNASPPPTSGVPSVTAVATGGMHSNVKWLHPPHVVRGPVVVSGFDGVRCPRRARRPARERHAVAAERMKLQETPNDAPDTLDPIGVRGKQSKRRGGWTSD
jgi:hypothetical protein